MKYAIISDIHGNYPAFKAVLADARAHGADMYLLLGDYLYRYPWVNDLVDELRNLKPACLIRGNGEGYLLNSNEEEMTCEQFKPLYWVCSSILPENLAYLASLPEKAVISHGDTNIYLAHSIDLFYRPTVIGFFHTLNFQDMMKASPISHREYLARGREVLLACPDALADIQALPKGIHLFGHNHLQFHMEYDGRLFINPGSCGMAADWDATAAYTLLSCENGRWTVLERRVEYDLSKVTEELVTSGYHDYAPMWSHAVKLQLLTGKEYFGWLVTHITETAKRMGHTGHPVSDDVWDVAVKTWGYRM